MLKRTLLYLKRNCCTNEEHCYTQYVEHQITIKRSDIFLSPFSSFRRRGAYPLPPPPAQNPRYALESERGRRECELSDSLPATRAEIHLVRRNKGDAPSGQMRSRDLLGKQTNAAITTGDYSTSVILPDNPGGKGGGGVEGEWREGRRDGGGIAACFCLMGEQRASFYFFIFVYFFFHYRMSFRKE